jgi:hypothetical protein
MYIHIWSQELILQLHIAVKSSSDLKFGDHDSILHITFLHVKGMWDPKSKSEYAECFAWTTKQVRANSMFAFYHT